MEPIAQGIVSGSVAALLATAILGLTKVVLGFLSKRQDINYISNILIQGRERVLEAHDTYNSGMDARMAADALRAAQYNNMLREVGVALERWTVHLSHAQRKDVYDALDWYHTGSLHATKRDGEAVFVELPEGRWPTTEMSLEAAREKFERLRAIRWLDLPNE